MLLFTAHANGKGLVGSRWPFCHRLCLRRSRSHRLGSTQGIELGRQNHGFLPMSQPYPTMGKH